MATKPDPHTVALLPAPDGYGPVDFDNPQRRGVPACYWITGVGFILATSFLTMRIFTKLRIVRDFKSEDWCVVGAYVFSIAVQGLLITSWASKAGSVHLWEEPISRFNFFLVDVLVAAVLYVPCLGLAKFSLLLFYYRMSRLQWLRFLSNCIMALVLGYSIATIFALIFPCKPIAKAWDVTITDGSCINRGAIYIFQAVTNIVTDVLLLLLPIPMVWRLHMPMQQKVGLVFIFIVGSLTCITSVVRLVLLLPTLTNPDQPWVIAIPSIWIGIEANLVIICCSLPALRLFVRYIAPRFIGEYSIGHSRPSRYGGATATPSNPSRLTSKIEDKVRSCSSYGRMDNSDAGTDVELQSISPKVWSQVTTEKHGGDTSHLDDPTPPGTATEAHPYLPSSGIFVTKTISTQHRG